MPHNRQPCQVAWAVTDFIRQRLLRERTLQFYSADLHRYVRAAVGERIAPGTPDRRLRLLQQGGVLRYALVSRTRGLYRAVSVNPRKFPKRHTGRTHASH